MATEVVDDDQLRGGGGAPLKQRKRFWTDGRLGGSFLVPTLVLLLIIAIFPLIWSLRLSFTDWSVIRDAGTDPQTIGFANYDQILGNGDTPLERRVGVEVADRFAITAQFVIPAVSIELLLGLGLALLLKRNFKGRGLMMTLMLLPMMLTPVVVALFWKFMFRTDIGVINYVLNDLVGLPRVDWLNNFGVAMWALVLTDVWMWTPFMMLIALAGLTAVPKYLYEAAEVDRASGWFKFRHVTLPMVAPLLMIALLFRTIEAYRLFDQAWVLTGGGPGTSTEVASLYLYQTAFRQFDTGLGSAIGYVMLIVIIALAALLIRALRTSQGAT